jgi:dTDP-4-amino-4,6-dideoxygalactose transaminase
LGPGQRDALKEKLGAQGIQTEVYYPRAMHEQECFGLVKEKFPVAIRLSQETLALPIPQDPNILKDTTFPFVK